MKLSIVLSTQPTSFSALAYKGEIESNIKKIKEFGYDGVELAVRNPEELDIEFIESIILKNDLIVPAIGTGQAFVEEGLSFTNPDPGIRQKAVGRIIDQVHLAKKFNAMVIIGLIRGVTAKNYDREKAESDLVDALRSCAAIDQEIKICIEPVNRYETNLINTADECLKIIERVGKPNVGILLDTFHMNIEEVSITESIKKAGNKLFHCHAADSNRWSPGKGHIDFASVLKTLKEIGYNGFISVEILPLPSPDLAAKDSVVYLKSLLGKQ